MTPAKLMFNKEIATKLPVVLEPERGVVQEERCKRYQDKLRAYADKKRRSQHHNLIVGDVVLVATLTQAKLTPSFSGNKYVILNPKGSDTFELVQVETGKRVIRNAKFLTKAPLHTDAQHRHEAEKWEEPQEHAPQQVHPVEETRQTPKTVEVPVTLPEEGEDQDTREFRRSARQPKLKRYTDHLYYLMVQLHQMHMTLLLFCFFL